MNGFNVEGGLGLTLTDKPISEDDEMALGEMLTNIYYGDDYLQVTVNPDKFHIQLENEYLYEAFSKLTSKQKVVIALAYSARYRDQEIANCFNVTQQSISKMRAKTLRNMRQHIPVAHLSFLQRGG